MEGTERHFGPFWEKEFGAISGGPFFSRPLWFTADVSWKGGVVPQGAWPWVCAPEKEILIELPAWAPKTSFDQKAREGCGCFRGLFGGSRGILRESPGKIAGKLFPESRNATNSGISGTRKGQPAGNLGTTLPGPRPNLPCGMFFEIDSSSLLEFF